MTATEQLIQLIQHHGADRRLIFHAGRIKCTAGLAIALMLLLFPASCSAATDGVTGNDDEIISLIIISPHDDDAWIDVVPPQIAVVGEASSPSGIRSITIRDSLDEVSCGNDTRFACSIPVSAGQNTITVIVEDNDGNRIEKKLNVTVHIGLPPPASITVSGRVTDKNGNPVQGAGVIFESDLTNDNIPLSVTAITGSDGMYLIKNAAGYRQNIEIQKDGYHPYQSGVVFENLTNRLDIELEPQNQRLPGFDLPLAVCSLGMVFIIIFRRKD